MVCMLIKSMFWKKERSEAGSREELPEAKGLYYAMWVSKGRGA
jgi:hypothetical protein